MNIAAVMAALDVWDLDHNAKMALLVVCCRADHRAGSFEVSTDRVAADMKVGYYAATSALERVVEAGYLTVEKPPGRKPVWQLTSAVDLRDLGDQPPRYVRDLEDQPPRSRPRTKDRKEKDIKKRAAASLARGATGGAGDNPPAARPDFAPGSGRLPDFTGTGRLHVVGDGPDQR